MQVELLKFHTRRKGFFDWRQEPKPRLRDRLP